MGSPFKIGIKLAWVLGLAPGTLSAQSFWEQFSYDRLRFTGIGVEIGPVWSDRVTTEPSGSVRVDWGLIAPRVRLVFSGNYFSGQVNQSEIAKLETQLRNVIDDPTGVAMIDVGDIQWRNLGVVSEVQYILPATPQLMFYGGAGLGVDFRNSSGPAIENTIVEDAFDTIVAAVVLSVGSEYAVTGEWFVTAGLTGMISSELRTLALRGGVMYRPPLGGVR